MFLKTGFGLHSKNGIHFVKEVFLIRGMEVGEIIPFLFCLLIPFLVCKTGFGLLSKIG